MKYFKVYPVTQDLFIFCGDRVTGKTYFAKKINVKYFDVGNIGFFIRTIGNEIRVNDVSHKNVFVLMTNNEQTVKEIYEWASHYLQLWNGEVNL